MRANAVMVAGLMVGAADVAVMNGVIAPRLGEVRVAPSRIVDHVAVAVAVHVADHDHVKVDDHVDDPVREIAAVHTRVVVVYFATDDARLDGNARAELDPLFTELARSPALHATLMGHADRRGTEVYNYRLGERRAEHVAAFLRERGIQSERLTVESFGKQKPVEDGETSEAMQRNRRVEIEITPQGGT